MRKRTSGPTAPAKGRRWRRSQRGVLEGLPLSLIISIFIIAVGSVVLLGLFSYSQGLSLSSISFTTPAAPFADYLTGTPQQLEVTAWARSGGNLGGVLITLNGTGVSEIGTTASNGSVFFWIVPVFHNHATSGVISVSASYSPGVSLVAQPHQTYSVSVPVLS